METNSPSLVKLNVGGKLFCTTKSTLVSSGDNFFTSLLSGRIPSAKDENGAYFIDRNGEYFGVILEYLRTGKVALPKHLDSELLALEADFYQIKLPLQSRVEEHVVEYGILCSDRSSFGSPYDVIFFDKTGRAAMAKRYYGEKGGKQEKAIVAAFANDLAKKGWRLMYPKDGVWYFQKFSSVEDPQV